MSKTARVFVAVHLPEPQRAALELTISSLRESGLSKVRWVRPEGVHLTLKFLGDIPASQIEAVGVAMRDAAKESSPFHLALGTLGAFPNLGRARVLWCGVQGDKGSLSQLQERTETGLEAVGYPRENRPFSPHITLGRLREGGRPPDVDLLQQALDACAPRLHDWWLVEDVCLMQTVLMPGGSRYEVIATATLDKGCQSWE